MEFTKEPKEGDEQKKRKEEFEKICKPVMNFLNKYFHPHSKVIIEPTSAELVSGEIVINEK